MKFKEVKIEDLIDEIAMGPFGSNIKKECFVEEGIPVLNGGNLTDFMLVEKKFSFVTVEKADSLKKANAYRGDIVITHRGTLGQIAYIPENSKYERYIISQSQFRVRLNNKVLPAYVVYYFHTRDGQYRLLSNKSQVGVPSLARPTTTFKTLSIPLPPLLIQKKIISILGCINEKIELNNKLNDNLEELMTNMYKAFFKDFKYYNGKEFKESELGYIPETWKIIRLEELCESFSKKHSFNKSELIFLNTGDVTNGIYSHRDYVEISKLPGQAKKTIQKYDILYSEIRPINRHFAFVDFEAQDYVVSTKLMVIRTKGIAPRRLYQYLTLSDTIEELQILAEGRSGTFPQITFDIIKNMRILIADKETEKRYSQIIDSLYLQIDENIKQNKKLIFLRETLLPKLMSGQIDLS